MPQTSKQESFFLCPSRQEPFIVIILAFSFNIRKIEHIIRVGPYELYDAATLSWQNVDKVCDQIFYVLVSTQRALFCSTRVRSGLR